MPSKIFSKGAGAAAVALGIGMRSMSVMAVAGATGAQAASAYIEMPSAHAFVATVDRITNVLQTAGMTIFARIDHKAAAQQVGLDMPPATVLIYGNPKGGTPLMVAAPALALDLPLRVMVREDAAGQTFVLWHPAHALVGAVGLSGEQAAPLGRGEALIRQAIAPEDKGKGLP